MLERAPSTLTAFFGARNCPLTERAKANYFFTRRYVTIASLQQYVCLLIGRLEKLCDAAIAILLRRQTLLVLLKDLLDAAREALGLQLVLREPLLPV